MPSPKPAQLGMGVLPPPAPNSTGVGGPPRCPSGAHPRWPRRQLASGQAAAQPLTAAQKPHLDHRLIAHPAVSQLLLLPVLRRCGLDAILAQVCREEFNAAP